MEDQGLRTCHVHITNGIDCLIKGITGIDRLHKANCPPRPRKFSIKFVKEVHYSLIYAPRVYSQLEARWETERIGH